MQKLSSIESEAFPQVMTELPFAPTAARVEKNPKLALLAYLREDCLRCHTGSNGRQKHGDFRVVGCTSCHVLYSNSGQVS